MLKLEADIKVIRETYKDTPEEDLLKVHEWEFQLPLAVDQGAMDAVINFLNG